VLIGLQSARKFLRPGVFRHSASVLYRIAIIWGSFDLLVAGYARRFKELFSSNHMERALSLIDLLL